ncbi:polysaccharide deacetylase family protein [Aquibacillus koreensis]|uniref:Polysaccharide deacetylase family protein n=1 Tax=Aquibacillus koreensis TaxID=279446 RepID=A0A9X3WJ51_9BACI|nr:polysaccharide deacetylase family protein [Aquibacillus koreensis]MCT2537666.1 polysaccharide deacetylase family protein [Aquibacillus koreensis]MDC3420987.1 polysaccharide deacetylase family protein [Aquibacillus koreensis]
MEKFGIINEVETDKKEVAITFDDGPNTTYTPQILDIFEAVSGQATFYMIGEQMKKHPEVVKDVLEKGHEIGNHTYSHPFLTKLHKDDAFQEVDMTDKLIEEMTGKKPKTFRPPFFDFNEETASIIDTFGYKTIAAMNVGAQDWEQPGVNQIVSESRKHIKPGSIFIFHDGFEERSQTVEAVRILVSELKEQGYELVTISKLLGLSE